MLKTNPVDGVIFDLDGTLLDTVEDIGAAANQALESAGHTAHDLEAYRNFVGHGSMELMRRALASGSPTDPEAIDESLVADLETRFQAAYEDHWNRNTGLYPGIGKLLDQLTAQQIPMAVLSNKPHRFTVKCVTEHLDRWSFSPVFGQRAQVPKKPDPQVALGIAESWGIEPQQIAFVGDTTVDLATGTRAGMRPFGVLWGFHDRSMMESFSLPLADNPEQLRSLFEI